MQFRVAAGAQDFQAHAQAKVKTLSLLCSAAFALEVPGSLLLRLMESRFASQQQIIRLSRRTKIANNNAEIRKVSTHVIGFFTKRGLGAFN